MRHTVGNPLICPFQCIRIGHCACRNDLDDIVEAGQVTPTPDRVQDAFASLEHGTRTPANQHPVPDVGFLLGNAAAILVLESERSHLANDATLHTVLTEFPRDIWNPQTADLA